MSKTIYGIHPSVMNDPSYNVKPNTFVSRYVFRDYKRKYYVEPIMPLICQNFIDLSDLGADNILGIYASYVVGHDRTSILNCPASRIANYLSDKYTAGKYIVFDNCQEGGVDIDVTKIHDAMKLTTIPLSAVYYISGAYNVKSAYDDYCVRHNITDKINVYHASPWECAPYTPYIAPEYTIKTKSKLFLCFNRMTRPHRVILVSLLMSLGLVDRAYYSYFPNADHGNNNVTPEKLITNFINNDEIRENALTSYCNNKHKFPLLLNISQHQNKTFTDNDDIKYYADSYFSLVTETFFFDSYFHHQNLKHDSTIFFSEKIFKPMFMKHPFVLVGRPGSLVALKEMGYKTFSPFIDETYDTIADNTQRMAAIVKEVERLNLKTDDEWIQWQTNVAEIVEHNYRTLTDRVCNLVKEKVKRNDI